MRLRQKRILKRAQTDAYHTPNLGDGLCWFEPLERREFLSVSIDGGTLTVIGSGGGDRISIKPGGGDGVVVVAGDRDGGNGTYTGINRVVIDGGGGNDKLTINPRTTDTNGDPLSAALSGGDGNDTLKGGRGDDMLSGGIGRDLIIGRDGNDYIAGGDGDDLIFGSDGDDSIVGSAGNDRIKGNNGRDRIDGGTGDDRIRGGRSGDRILGGSGSDLIRGQNGLDTVSYRFAESSVDLNLAQSRAEDDGTGSVDPEVRGFEEIVRSRFEDRIDIGHKSTRKVPPVIVEPPTGIPHATWVWNEMQGILADAGAMDQALEFLDERGMTTVYIYAAQFGFEGPYPLVDQPFLYEQLIAQLHSRGVKVHALFDGIVPDADPGGVPLTHLGNILDYNADRDSNERFDGVHMDLEPWQLPDWESNRDEYVQQYLQLVDRVADVTHAQAADTVVAFDIPFWFDTITEVEWDGTIKPLNEHAQDLTDAVTVMDFRDTALGPDGILAHAATELAYANTIGKPVVIGVEASGPLSLDKISFVEEGRVVLDQELAIAAGELADDAAFVGFAIQHFGSLQDLVFDGVPPNIFAALTNDTGLRTTDGITGDPSISSTFEDHSPIVTVLASFDGSGIVDPIDLLALLEDDGQLLLDAGQLETINGAALADGMYVLVLEAEDRSGNRTRLERAFTLDTTAPGVTGVDLDPGSDTGSIGDQTTHLSTVTITGVTDPRATVVLLETGRAGTADADGKFAIDDVPLADGVNTLTLRSTDLAGNTSDVTRTTIERLADPTLVLDDFESYDSGQVIGESATSSPWRHFGTATGDNITATDAAGSVVAGAVSGRYDLDWDLGDFASARFVFDEPTDLSGLDFARFKIRSTALDTSTMVRVAITSGETTYITEQVESVFPSLRAPTYRLAEQDLVHVGDTPLIPYDELVASVTEIGFDFTRVEARSPIESILFDDFVLLQDVKAPEINVSLTNDTGDDPDDMVTFDLSMGGTVTDELPIVSLRAGFDDMPVDTFVDIAIDPDDPVFELDSVQVGSIAVDPLIEGPHTAHWIATDARGNRSAITDVAFVLVSETPGP